MDKYMRRKKALEEAKNDGYTSATIRGYTSKRRAKQVAKELYEKQGFITKVRKESDGTYRVLVRRW